MNNVHENVIRLIKELIRYELNHGRNVRDNWEEIEWVVDIETMEDVMKAYYGFVERYGEDKFFIGELEQLDNSMCIEGDYGCEVCV